MNSVYEVHQSDHLGSGGTSTSKKLMCARQVPSAQFTTGLRQTFRPSDRARVMATTTSSSVTVGASRQRISVDCAVSCRAAKAMGTQLTAVLSAMVAIDSAAEVVAHVPRSPTQPHVIPATYSVSSSTSAT